MALTKPNGRVRGIVVGDVLRRLVSRCLAQKYSQPIHTACQPHQFALATRSGTEAVVHALTAVTEANPTHTILSVDGVGAYDNISRNSMLQGLRDVPAANRCLPFVRMFYGAPSHYIWHSATGEAHIISQAQGGEQGDPLMPALFSLGQRAALRTMQQHLLPNEALLAFLDDVYVVVPPNRVRPVYDTLAHTLQSQASIQLNQGKTRAWNAAGTRTTKHPGPRRRRVGWQPQFTSYIPGHDRPRGPHRLSRFRSAPTPTGEPTTSNISSTASLI